LEIKAFKGARDQVEFKEGLVQKDRWDCLVLRVQLADLLETQDLEELRDLQESKEFRDQLELTVQSGRMEIRAFRG
jgi:hypothetical protein